MLFDDLVYIDVRIDTVTIKYFVKIYPTSPILITIPSLLVHLVFILMMLFYFGSCLAAY